jgi:hypothetical protein
VVAVVCRGGGCLQWYRARAALSQRIAAAERELVAAHQVAWNTYLPRLATVLAGRDPGPDPHSAS